MNAPEFYDIGLTVSGVEIRVFRLVDCFTDSLTLRAETFAGIKFRVFWSFSGTFLHAKSRIYFKRESFFGK